MKKFIVPFALACAFALSAAGCSGVKAGTYAASERGFGGDVTVSLTLDASGKITDAVIAAPNETPNIGGAAAVKLSKEIVSSQTIALDSVSGATVTSTAVFRAAEAALKKSGAKLSNYKKAVAKSGSDEEITVDVVVAGAGGSGTAAALAASEAGLRGVILEKLR